MCSERTQRPAREAPTRTRPFHDDMIAENSASRANRTKVSLPTDEKPVSCYGWSWQTGIRGWTMNTTEDDPGQPSGGTSASSAADPVHARERGHGRDPEPGLALCLSGGGYRAMLFHVGVLWRLNDAGVLVELDRVSSVSGGSITAGVLARSWGSLEFDAAGKAGRFVEAVVDPVRRLASRTIDVGAVLAGLAIPFRSVSDQVAAAYRKHLFGRITLQALPDRPRFVINATNMESSALMRFSKPFLADYRVGIVRDPDVELADAVAASSAFPPFLAPYVLDLRKAQWVVDPLNFPPPKGNRGKISLADGGIYDNLGLETAWKRYQTILVSDGGGGPLDAMARPWSDWPRQMIRVLMIMDSQVRALRKRQVVDAFTDGRRSGMYVGIRSSLADYPVADPLTILPASGHTLAETPTRLAALADTLQRDLINWGYAICDAGLRSYFRPGVARGTLPYE